MDRTATPESMTFIPYLAMMAGDGAAAACVDATELAGLEVHARLVHDVADEATYSAFASLEPLLPRLPV